MPDRHLAQCAHCRASLLREDYHGKTCKQMNRALAHHSSGNCASNNIASEAATLLSLINRGDSYAPWICEEPPLIFAARHSQADLLSSILLTNNLFGAGIDHIAPSGHSSLHLAAERDNAAIVTALLAAGASPELVSQDTTKCDAPLLAGGMLPLHCAAAAGASTAAGLLDSIRRYIIGREWPSTRTNSAAVWPYCARAIPRSGGGGGVGNGEQRAGGRRGGGRARA